MEIKGTKHLPPTKPYIPLNKMDIHFGSSCHRDPPFIELVIFYFQSLVGIHL